MIRATLLAIAAVFLTAIGGLVYLVTHCTDLGCR